MDWRVMEFLTRFQYRKAGERFGNDERRRIIEDAVKRGMDIEIIYLRPDDTKSRRKVTPISIEEMEYRGKTFEGLRALCWLRKEKRTFRIDRILEISYDI
jgi:predicted DNA-binding transcriptional regulator YafY